MNPAVRQVYFEALKKILIIPCVDVLHQEIDGLYVKERASRTEKDTLNSLLRVYRVLGGDVEPEKHKDLLEGILLKNKRWTGSSKEGLGAGRAQFRFLLTQLDRKQDWVVPIQKEFVERVNRRVAMALWVLQAYRDMVEAGISSYPTKITGETAIKTRGREMLDFGYSFSEAFTQKGWNNISRRPSGPPRRALPTVSRKRSCLRPGSRSTASSSICTATNTRCNGTNSSRRSRSASFRTWRTPPTR